MPTGPSLPVNGTLYRDIPGHITQIDVSAPWNTISVQAVSVNGATSALATISTAPSWALRFGGTGWDQGTGVARDSSGNIVVVGVFNGTIDLGGGPLTSAGLEDMFIAKFTPTGNHIWSKRYGGVGGELPACVALDTSDNIVVGGTVYDTADLGGGPVSGAGANDIFVAKYTATGVYQWAKRFGGADNDSVKSLAVDASGNVIFTGVFVGNSINFGGADLINAGSGQNAYLVKLAGTNGAHTWSKNFASGASRGEKVAIHPSGDIITTGWFGNFIDCTTGFVGFPYPPTTLVTAGGGDFYIARFQPNGSHVWSKRFGGESDDNAHEMAVDTDGNFYVLGSFTLSLDLGNGHILTTPYRNGLDIFLAKFSSAGTALWARHFPGFGGSEVGTGLAVDSSGDVTFVGNFSGSISFDGHVLQGASTDIFVAKYSSAGGYLWSKRFGGTSSDFSTDLALDATGHPIITGSFQGVADFGGVSLTSAGSLDVFLCRVTPPIGFARQFGGPGFAHLYGLAVDSKGNIFTGGVFTDTINCGQGPLNTGGNQFALFVAKYSPAGQCLWQRRFTVTGTIASPSIQGIAVGGDGNIFLTGHFTGTANFGGSNLVQFGIRRNGFLVKLNGYGDHVWSKRFKNIDSGVTADWGCQPISVKVNSAGAVIIAGTLGTETTFNDTQTTIGAADTGLHTFIVKFTADGTWVWERTFNCGADIYIRAMVVDSEDNIVAGGSFQGSANFGGSDIASHGWADMYIAKLDSDGAHLWSRGGGGFVGSEEVMAVALDSNDNIYAGGHFFATAGFPANFGGADLVSAAGVSAWLAKYDSSGNHVWSQTFADQPLSYDDVIAMAVDSNDDLIVCGNYRSPGSFGGVRLPFYAAQDCWVAKYDSTGANQWTYGIHYDGGVFVQSQESMFAIAVDPDDNIIGTLQSDAPSLTIANRTFANSSASFDGYLFKHGPTP